jgi:hypothetical protein
MIGLKFQNTATKTYAIPEVWVKSISAAWKQIREWRDTLPFETLEGAILLVDLDGEPINSDRIPAKILFKANKNGKLEFKDLSKQKPQNAPEEKKEEAKVESIVASKKAPRAYSCVTKRGLVDMKKIFNPLF